MKPVLVARRLSVGYDGRAVVSGVDVLIAAGGSVALVGSNGSGKSTLLKTFAGLLAPVGGAFEVLGRPIVAASTEVAYLSQSHPNGLALPIRSIDIVRMARFDQRGRFRRRSPSDDAIVNESLERMGVAHLGNVALRDLSGGQQQRVFLAQALARRASLLLLDEPTAGLDATGRAAYLEAMAAERERGAAVVTATHDVGEASSCDRVLLLAGRLIADGPPNTVLTPENLLATFGVGLTRVHDQLVVTEHQHHEH